MSTESASSMALLAMLEPAGTEAGLSATPRPKNLAAARTSCPTKASRWASTRRACRLRLAARSNFVSFRLAPPVTACADFPSCSSSESSIAAEFESTRASLSSSPSSPSLSPSSLIFRSMDNSSYDARVATSGTAASAGACTASAAAS